MKSYDNRTEQHEILGNVGLGLVKRRKSPRLTTIVQKESFMQLWTEGMTIHL